ncbi:MAG: DNA polymerase I [Bdellovibrionales bacterium]|nr:DNA polymerase I [Bdellovibrionales bacterium]
MNRSDALADPVQTLFLIDVSSFIFRAYYAIRSLTNAKNEPTNAIYGVATMLARLVEEAKPEHIAVVYDSKGPSFRKEMYADYKANRSAPPDDLVPQFERIDELIRLMGFASYRQTGVEADDLIATLTKRWVDEDPKHRVVVVTGDKDLMQLVTDRVSVWDTMAQKFYDPKDVEEKFGVRPDQVRDLLALVGDSSDNIPGVEGIGPKGAVDLLKEYGTLDGILQAAKAEKVPGKKGQNLRDGEKDARLSADLASLKTDCEIQLTKQALVYRFEPSPDLMAFLKEMDFGTLVKKWSAQPGASGSGPITPVTSKSSDSFGSATQSTLVGSAKASDKENESAEAFAAHAPPVITGAVSPGQFHAVQDEAGFNRLLEKLDRSPEFGFDLETTSLNPREAGLVGVAISVDSETGHYIPVGHRGLMVGNQLPESLVLEKLKPILENPRHKKIGQNLKYDFSVLLSKGLKPDGIGADTMVASYVLDPEGRHNLERLSASYLGYQVLTYEEVCGKGKDQISFADIPIDRATRYSAEDAWIAKRLWNHLKPLIQKEGLMEVFAKVDLPLVGVLTRMEMQGVCLDDGYLRTLSTEFGGELKQIEEKISKYTNGPVNLNSPRQLGTLLFDQLGLPPQGKTKTGYSTDASVLESLAPLHEVPRLLLEYREISKLKGTYVDPLPMMKDSRTGKIHSSFQQTVAATGRLASSDPNLQNIPIRTLRGRKIRKAFLPSPGNVLVSADYSQIELRLLAHMSGDRDLVDSFNRNEDVHRRTASEIYGIAPDQVDDQKRGIAKAINFGLMYGKTPFGLAAELGIPQKEAKEMIGKYFARYSGVKRFLDRLIQDAKETGVSHTLLGRRRLLRDINAKNPMLRNMAERMAMNTPIQGTAADLIKMAMISLDEKLSEKGFRSKMIIQVHDEIVLDCPKDEEEAAKKLVIETMEGAMNLSVPLSVNAASGQNWMDL